jgi:Mitochondrial ATP synthase epsilon chain
MSFAWKTAGITYVFPIANSPINPDPERRLSCNQSIMKHHTNVLPSRYNRYLAIAARVVRRSLKEDKRLAADARGNMELRFAKWEVRLHVDETVQSRALELTRMLQGGKQGENKSLAAANKAAREAAGASEAKSS